MMAQDGIARARASGPHTFRRRHGFPRWQSGELPLQKNPLRAAQIGDRVCSGGLSGARHQPRGVFQLGNSSLAHRLATAASKSPCWSRKSLQFVLLPFVLEPASSIQYRGAVRHSASTMSKDMGGQEQCAARRHEYARSSGVLSINALVRVEAVQTPHAQRSAR